MKTFFKYSRAETAWKGNPVQINKKEFPLVVSH